MVSQTHANLRKDLRIQKERAFWSEQLASARGVERKGILEDFLWSLLNCREFKTNR